MLEKTLCVSKKERRQLVTINESGNDTPTSEMGDEPVPLVSVVLPIYNEAADIDVILNQIALQTHQDFEVLLADGGSDDGTIAILNRWVQADDRFHFVNNRRKLQSAGLNTALQRCRGRYLVRLDGHSFIQPDYVQRCVELLERTGAGVVGGRMVATAVDSPTGRGIALANQSPWGAGPARFHAGAESGPAETVYLGAFQTTLVRELGGWAEDVGVNEDYELNHRIRQSGHAVWLDVDLCVGYRPRSTFKSLAIQYFRYGRSKAVVMRRHPDSVRVRQVLPALLFPTPIGLFIRPTRLIAIVGIGTHFSGVITGALGSTAPVPERVLGAAAALIMHWSWSAGFWFGLVRRFPRASEV